MRAAVALLAFVAGPAGAVWLVANGRLPQAGILTLALAVYALAEVLAYYRRDQARARAAWRSERRAGRPLATYTPQTEDHLADDEYRRGRWAV